MGEGLQVSSETLNGGHEVAIELQPNPSDDADQRKGGSAAEEHQRRHRVTAQPLGCQPKTRPQRHRDRKRYQCKEEKDAKPQAEPLNRLTHHCLQVAI